MKSSETEYIELVKQAQQGNEESRNRLAEISRDRLRMYVYRLTLDADLTEDILQESMLEMFKFLDKLERTEGFWSWVLRIATNNVKDHYKREQRRRASDTPIEQESGRGIDRRAWRTWSVRKSSRLSRQQCGRLSLAIGRCWLFAAMKKCRFPRSPK